MNGRVTLIILSLTGVLAADGGESVPPPPTNWSNVGLIAGIVVAVVTAGIALYRASAQRGLDQGTKAKIDEEVRRLQTEHDRRRTIRLLRLERYADEDVDYHRRLNTYIVALRDLIEEAREAGFLPAHGPLPTPPDPPQLPQMPDGADDL